jgi:hypothetical protein
MQFTNNIATVGMSCLRQIIALLEKGSGMLGLQGKNTNLFWNINTTLQNCVYFSALDYAEQASSTTKSNFWGAMRT